MSVNDLHRTQKPVVVQQFEVKKGANEFSTTYVFGNEDHTLGNCLRHVLMQQPETDFCGYSVPHPYEPKMNVRLQTKGMPAGKVLVKGFAAMEKLCDDLDSNFSAAVDEYRKTNPQ